MRRQGGGHEAHLANVNAISDHLWGVALPVLIGFAAGALAVLLMERARLRWTWALPVWFAVYALWVLDWHLGLGLGAAAGAALWLGVQRHNESVQRGGEEARKMRDAPGPLGWLWSQLRSRRARAGRVKDGQLAIGSGKRGPCQVPIGIDRGVHALISGATGGGKTVTQAAICQAYARARFGQIVVDPKGDAYLRAVLQDHARAARVRFVEWSPTGPTVYNPLARGGPTEIADKALAAHRWSEPHYELATRRLLGQALATMQAAGLWPPTLSQLVAHMDPERLDVLASEVGGETAERVSAYVDGLDGRGKADLGGGRDRLAVLIDSELGPWFDPSVDGSPQINLAESLRRKEIVYFNLDADRYPAAAKLVASALMIDLVGLAADLQAKPYGGLVVIDEFAAVAAEHVSRLFARARSAGVSVVLGTQSLADLRGARPDDPSDTLTEQVLSNIECAIVHRVGDPDSAERFARMAGTTPSWSVTQRVSPNGPVIGMGEGTRTREREFLVGPDEFKRLRPGEAVVICPSAKRPAQLVRIWPPQSPR